MTDTQRAWLYLHISVVCWGFTAVLGRLISLPALPLVWWRVVLTVGSILVFLPLAEIRKIRRADGWKLFAIGGIVGLHWLCFYGAIKLANASVGVVSMAATSFFTAILEPFLMKSKVKWYEIGLGLLILPGMFLIVENLDWALMTGFAVGLLGAFLAAVFSILNKKMVDSAPAAVLTFIEMSAIVVLISVLLPIFFWQNPTADFLPKNWDWLWLAVLAFACTTVPYQLSLISLKHLTAFASNLVINLEPVYGIALAGLLLNEHRDLKIGFYLGVVLVILVIFCHPFLKKMVEKEAV